MVNRTVIFLCAQGLDPYHLARFRAFRDRWPDMEVVLVPVAGGGRPWQVRGSSGLPVRRPYEAGPMDLRSHRRALQQVRSYLLEARPAALVATRYRGPMRRYVAETVAGGSAAILLLASTYEDKARHFWREWPKRWITRGFDAVAAVGERSARYAERLGVPPGRIWRIGNVVDNQHFASGASAARRRAAQQRQALGLPERYFLCVSRLSPEKNLDTLIRAFAAYRNAGGTWHLVVVGSGPDEGSLGELVQELAPGTVHLVGWKQYQDLPAYYGLASCFVLASVSEPWGLVVNEAMASGLAVLVSRRCGCLPELCWRGVNGYDFDPGDAGHLTELLLRISSAKTDLAAMGEASRRIVANFTPETWARALRDCIESTLEGKHVRS